MSIEDAFVVHSPRSVGACGAFFARLETTSPCLGVVKSPNYCPKYLDTVA